MTTTEIKKELYKQKPTAYLDKIRLGIAYYTTTLNKGTDSARNIEFQVPVADMGDADFESTMPAKLLNRWIINN